MTEIDEVFEIDRKEMFFIHDDDYLVYEIG